MQERSGVGGGHSQCCLASTQPAPNTSHACALLDEGHSARSKAESNPVTLRSGWLKEEAAELWALVPGPSPCPGHN